MTELANSDAGMSASTYPPTTCGYRSKPDSRRPRYSTGSPHE